MKNLFKENRFIWETSPESIPSKQAPAPATEAVAATPEAAAAPKSSAEQVAEKEKIAKENRDKLKAEIELKKSVLYKKIIDSYKDVELSSEEKGKPKKDGWLKREIWNKAMSMDENLWKDVELKVDLEADIWQAEGWGESIKDNPLKALVEAGKRNEVLAEMFETDVLAKLKDANTDKVDAQKELVLFKIEDTGNGAVKVVTRTLKKDSEEYKKIVGSEASAPVEGAETTTEVNYDGMATTILKEGGFVVGLMSMFGIIPNQAKDGKTVAELQKEAVMKGLRGEDPILGWIFGVIGIKGCEGNVAGIESFVAGTSFGETYDKLKAKVAAQRGKMKDVVDKVNGVADVTVSPQEQAEQSKSVLADVGGDYVYAGEQGKVFSKEERVKDGHNLEILIPYEEGAVVTFGGNMTGLKDANGALMPAVTRNAELKAQTTDARVVIVPAGTTIPKDTKFTGKNLSYRYVKQEAPAS